MNSHWSTRTCSTENVLSPIFSPLHHGSVAARGVNSKWKMLLHIYRCFLAFFVFSHSHSFFWWSIKFPQQNIDQSETGISDKKLSVELYDNINYKTRLSSDTYFLKITFLRLKDSFNDMAFTAMFLNIDHICKCERCFSSTEGMSFMRNGTRR